MNKLLLITSFLTIIYTNFSYANTESLFQKCDELRQLEKWDDFQTARTILEKEIENIGYDYQAPYWKKFNLLTLKALLQKRKYRQLYNFIYSEAHHYFKDLCEYERSYSHLHKRLITPTEKLRPYAALHAKHIHELILALAEHDLYTNDLKNAYNLSSTLINFTQREKLSHGSRFIVTDVDLLIRALIIRGKTSYYRGDIEASESDFKAALKLQKSTNRTQRGHIYLGTARAAFAKGDIIKASFYQILAKSTYDKDSRHAAYASLLEAEIKILNNSTKAYALDLLQTTISKFFTLDDQFGRGLGLFQLYKADEHSQDESHYQLLEQAGNIANKKYEPLLMHLVMERGYEPQQDDSESEDELSDDEENSDQDTGEDLVYHTYPLEQENEPFGGSWRRTNNYNMNTPHRLTQEDLDLIAEKRFPDRNHPEIKAMIKNKQNAFEEKMATIAEKKVRAQSPIIGESESSASTSYEDDPIEVSSEIFGSPDLGASPLCTDDIAFHQDSPILTATQILDNQ